MLKNRTRPQSNRLISSSRSLKRIGHSFKIHPYKHPSSPKMDLISMGMYTVKEEPARLHSNNFRPSNLARPQTKSSKTLRASKFKI